jgi:hypothetical protein
MTWTTSLPSMPGRFTEHARPRNLVDFTDGNIKDVVGSTNHGILFQLLMLLTLVKICDSSTILAEASEV